MSRRALTKKQAKADMQTLKEGIAARVSEFFDAHLMVGIHAESGQVVFYASGRPAQRELMEEALLVAAKEIERGRAKGRRKR